MGSACAPETAAWCRAAAIPNTRSGSSASSWRSRSRSSPSSSWLGKAMRVLSVVGARPNFMKLAPVDRELVRRGVEHVIVHTGQHYDPGMSDAFFEQLWIPAPDHDLGVGSGSHAQQTAAVMQRLEPVVVEVQPDLVLTYGDVNSTVAAALVAAKLQMRVGHVEAGLRSRDWTMPEEINRVVTDRLSDLLFLPSRDAAANLEAEGIPADRMHFVGNVLIEPVGYLDMLSLVANAGLVVTDSGGLQEETSFLGVPCLTVRPNTERPITCTHGTNRLVQPQRDAILAAAERALGRRSPARPVIERWDGRAAARIAQVVCDGERFELDGALAAPAHAPRRAVAIPQPLGAS